MMPRPRRTILAVAAALLLVVCAGKAATMFLAGEAAREVAMARRVRRDLGKEPTAAILAREVKPLLAALRWTPEDADLWYQLARDLHRLADLDYDPRRVVDDLSRALEVPDDAPPREFLLTAAAAAYDRAIAANQLISGARFWRAAVDIALVGTQPARWRAEWRDRVRDALEYDPVDPTLWRAAGDLAFANDDRETAVAWYRQSLTENLSGTEAVVANLLGAPDGMELVFAAIPRRTEAWRRLAATLLDRWRFDAAATAFDVAMELAGTSALHTPADEAVADGDFGADATRLLHPWIVEPAHGVEVSREVLPEESTGLRVDFRHGPANWYHVTQRVPVTPGARYRLSARVAVEGFAPEETFGIEVVHPYAIALFTAGARCYAGGGPFHQSVKTWPVSDGRFVEIAATLSVPDDLAMLEVRLRRFDGDPGAAGRVTFTGISLRREPREEGADDAGR